ncbi:MAG: MBL fold metallo-hydrolase [Acidimicrobiia bacterium]|nr:MBL fold metallo-hydrolase [Acidimicrobiia bacterium]
MSESFDLIELAAGVHGAVSDIAGPAVGNAAIIDTGDKTVVIDSFMTAQAAAELRNEAVRLTGRSAFLLVNTHWHGDHTWGNQVFDDIPIASTRRTLELIIADAPANLVAYEAELDAQLTALRVRLESDDASVRAAAARRVRGVEAYKAAAPGFRLTLPDLLFDDHLVIEGRRRVELMTYGGGHTESDVFAWIPDAGVMIAGDLCWNRIHPRTLDGDPGDWAGILERMARLAPMRVHPGHGEPGGPEVIEALVPYLRTVAGYVTAVRAGTDPAGLAPPPGSEAWASPERMRTGVAGLAARPHPSANRTASGWGRGGDAHLR